MPQYILANEKELSSLFSVDLILLGLPFTALPSSLSDELFDLRNESSTKKKVANKIIINNRQAYLDKVDTNFPVHIFSCFRYNL